MIWFRGRKRELSSNGQAKGTAVSLIHRMVKEPRRTRVNIGSRAEWAK